MSEDKNLRGLLLQATKDPDFRMKFLKNPEVVAKECNVKLKPDQLEKIKKTIHKKPQKKSKNNKAINYYVCYRSI